VKSVLDVNNLGSTGPEENADDVKPEIVAGSSLARHPITRCTSHFTLFFPVYGAKRAAVAS
jgi:hypothetical protein